MPDTPVFPDAALRAIPHFVGTRASAAPMDRRRAIVKAAHALREELASAPPVTFYKACNLIRAPYPTKYALRDACTAATPFVHILNRLFVVQFPVNGVTKTLLVSPTDPKRNAATPYFNRLAKKLPERLHPVLAPEYATVAQWLEKIGIAPEQVDYITYDHLHTQDVRGWLGSHGTAGLFPNAKLLVMREEWESAKALLPPQRDWYCPNGTDGVPAERVVLLDTDTMLGDSVVLMRTPGHTYGNHSIVVRTPEGSFVTSENGVSVDAYAPLESKIPGVRRWARETGMDIVLNGNTLESGLDQYLSMVQEREVAGPSQRNPAFPNFMPSSELTSYWAFPGVAPTFAFGELEFGAPVKAESRSGARR
jgi:hypothetical protein